MTRKKLKYQELLAQFPNCPPDNYLEIQQDAFRWVHKEEHENDFLPVLRINPFRKFDDSDEMCTGYGLSLYDTLDNALSRYKDIYTKIKEHQRPKFVSEKGDQIAAVQLTFSDGIADQPTINGHFNFHEYENTNLRNKVVSIFAIFDNNGNFIS